MSTPKPCWFLAPRACPPNGPIKLGNIITSPDSVDDPLFNSSEPLPKSEEVIIYEEHGFKLLNKTTQSRRIGVMTTFLQSVLGLGLDAYGNWENSNGHQLHVRKMTTQWFTPSLGFAEGRVAEAAVKRYITKTRFRSKAFMVTGIMIASGGASSSVTLGRERGGGVSLNVDATPFGAPVGGGPNLHLARRTETEVSAVGADDFVFAYRLREIKVKRGGEVLQKSYKKGALYDVNTFSEEYEQLAKESAMIQVVVEGMVDEDVSGDAFGLEDEDGVDEASGEECHYVLPE